jgi:DNA end-binding protein Ku
MESNADSDHAAAVRPATKEKTVARVIWKGAITFSLIHIPVALHGATRSRALDLDLLDKRDFSPVGYQRVNKTNGKNVDWKDIVKGYKYEGDQYVVLTEEDFRRANVEATQTIDIQSFVEPAAIPPYFYDTPYYVAPQARSEKVYRLLRDALERSGKIALALTVIRTRQYLCALLPIEDGLMLNTLRYADEVLPGDDYSLKAAKPKKGTAVSSKEMALATKLIEDMSEAWNAKLYRDTYREDLLKRIEEKIRKGQTRELTAPAGEAAAPAPTQLADLSALLQRSLASAGPRRQSPRTRRRAKPQARSAPKRRA